MSNFWKIVLGSFCIFFFSWLFVYKTGINKLAIQSEDTVPGLFLPAAIIKEKTLYLDTYYPEMLANYPHPEDRELQKGLTPFYVRIVGPPAEASEQAGDRVLSAFPIITPLLMLPLYFLANLVGINFDILSVTVLGHIGGALIVSFAGGLLYKLLKEHFGTSEKMSLILTLVYLFGTINYALVSQALWQHGTAQLLLITATLFLYKKKWFLMAFAISLAILARQTTGIAAFFLGLIFLKEVKFDFKKWGLFLAGVLLPVLFFIWYTKVFYLGISNNGYANHVFTSWLGKFPVGFLGLWFSPSKGLLVYSPIFIFSLIGFWMKRKDFNFLMFGLIILEYTLVMGTWKHWYGGWSFGYRMAADVIPFFIILMVPFVQSAYFERFKRVFFALFGVSLLMQLQGILFFDGVWHAIYDEGIGDTSWVWSIKNSETAFNIRRVLVKLDIIEKACQQCP